MLWELDLSSARPRSEAGKAEEHPRALLLEKGGHRAGLCRTGSERWETEAAKPFLILQWGKGGCSGWLDCRAEGDGKLLGCAAEQSSDLDKKQCLLFVGNVRLNHSSVSEVSVLWKTTRHQTLLPHRAKGKVWNSCGRFSSTLVPQCSLGPARDTRLCLMLPQVPLAGLAPAGLAQG